MNIVDQYLGGFPWLIIGVVELFCIAWIYGTVTLNSLDFHIYFVVCIILGMDNFCDDIAIMLGEERRPSKFWQICWKYISPLILLVIIFFFFLHIWSSMKFFLTHLSSLVYHNLLFIILSRCNT